MVVRVLPLLLQKATVCLSTFPTLKLIWLTAGWIFAVVNNAVSCAVLKFDTPIARTFFAPTAASIAAHVVAIDAAVLPGVWMSSRSTYSTISCAMSYSMDAATLAAVRLQGDLGGHEELAAGHLGLLDREAHLALGQAVAAVVVAVGGVDAPAARHDPAVGAHGIVDRGVVLHLVACQTHQPRHTARVTNAGAEGADGVIISQANPTHRRWRTACTPPGSARSGARWWSRWQSVPVHPRRGPPPRGSARVAPPEPSPPGTTVQCTPVRPYGRRGARRPGRRSRRRTRVGHESTSSSLPGQIGKLASLLAVAVNYTAKGHQYHALEAVISQRTCAQGLFVKITSYL